jgi:hypothetical protein
MRVYRRKIVALMLPLMLLLSARAGVSQEKAPPQTTGKPELLRIVYCSETKGNFAPCPT